MVSIDDGLIQQQLRTAAVITITDGPFEAVGSLVDIKHEAVAVPCCSES